jgi:uncharacterized membrane protein
MSNNWLQREGPTWVQKKIITHEQYEEILKLYPTTHQRVVHVLPIFASVLVALSLLTFVASNWEAIPQLGRLAVLFATMIGFYLSGFYAYRNSHEWVGQGLLVMGVISFGASMILIGQMFHLIAYGARLFVFWSLAAVTLLYMYRRYVFYFLTAALLLAGQIYSASSFHEASGVLLALTLIGLGHFTYKAESAILGWILAPLISVQTILLWTIERDAWAWICIVPMGIYVIGLWLEERPISVGFLTWPAIFGFSFSTLMVFVHRYLYQDSSFLSKPLPFLIFFFVLFIMAIWKTRGQKGKWLPLILLLPLFYLSIGDIAYLVVMFLYASLLIYFGDQENLRVKSNIGVFLFMFSSLVGYVQIAWDFLDKSLFFLIGGLILFSIHWILRKRKRWLVKGGDQPW